MLYLLGKKCNKFIFRQAKPNAPQTYNEMSDITLFVLKYVKIALTRAGSGVNALNEALFDAQTTS